MINEDSLHKRNAAILPHLDERQRRLFAAAEAKAAGHGGIAAVSRVTRIAASTIGRGLKDIEAPDSLAPGRVRRPGGGRKSLTETDPRLLDDLNARARRTRRSDVVAALDLQEPAPAGGRTQQARSPDQPHRCRRVAEGAEVQPASQSQDARRRRQSRPRRPVRLHQRGGYDGHGAEPAGDLRRHKKKGTGWGFQEPRARMASARRARRRARARLSDQGAWTRRALWNL